MLPKVSKLDIVFRKLLLTKFFTKGWGSVDNLKRMCEFGKVISDRSQCKHLVDKNYPIIIDKNEKRGECRVVEGHFLSPFAKYIKGIMPLEVETARFQVILPLQWKTNKKPVCIHLAGTGDHGFWRRRTIMARPLLKEYGIASIILENPFYGLRKPKDQLRSSLLNVSDLFVMGGALVLETLTLLHWCEKEGYGPLGISGVSLGGHMATLAATNWHKPLALIPCLSWSSATPTFTHGVMSGAIPWKTLASEYIFHSEYEAEILRKLMKCPQYDAYRLGQEFAANFSDSVEELGNMNLDCGVNRSEQATCNSKEKQDAASKRASSNSQEQSPQQSVVETDEPVLGHEDKCNDSSIQDLKKVPSSDDTHQNCENSSPNCGNLSNDEMQNIQNVHSSVHENMQVENTSTKSSQSYMDSTFSGVGTGTAKVGDKFVSSEKNDKTKHNKSGHKVDFHKQLDSTSGNNKLKQEFKGSETKSRTEETTKKIKIKKLKTKWKLSKDEYSAVKDDALQFMKGVMDASTFVGNFSKPVDPELVISILANQDAYIPWYQMPSLQELWPGMEVRYVNAGHVAAILFKQHHFRQAIHDAFQKMNRKYDGVFPEES